MLRLAQRSVGARRDGLGETRYTVARGELTRASMFENALVGVDGSSSGQDAVVLAAALLADGAA